MSRSLTSCLLLLLTMAALGGTAAAAAGEPDLAEWNRLLAAYYDPAKGMDYGALEAKEVPALQKLRQAMARVDVGSLSRDEQLAYWINLYNVNVVSIVVDGYPVASIRDLSTDPLIRLNVFKKDAVPFGNGKVSLNFIENDKVRAGFQDPRIHFAINCAAKSCPPLRKEAYAGARVGEQLDDQTRKFLAGPGLRVEAKGGKTILHVTKIMDWFEDDFEKWGGGRAAFVRKHAPAEKAKLIPAGGKVELEFDDYDWSLNDWKR
jgi:hypothetical protein